MWEDKVVRQGCHQLKTTLGDRGRRGMSHSHTILMTVWTVWGTGSLEFIVLPPECTALQRKRKVVAGLPLIIRVPATCFFSVQDACGLWMCACVCMCVYVITQLLKGLQPPAVSLVMTAVHSPTFMPNDPGNYLVHLTPLPFRRNSAISTPLWPS